LGRDETHALEDGDSPGSVPVAPVVGTAGLSTAWQFIAVALIVGVVSFVAGAGLGTGRGTVEPIPSGAPARPSPSGLPLSTAPSAVGASDTSEFARDFRPQDMIAALDGGSACSIHTSSVSGFPYAEPTRTLVRSWLVFCPFDAVRRAPFLRDLTIALERQIPFGTMSSFGDNRGMMLAYYPYREGPLVGQVAVATGPAGAGVQVAITLEERLGQ
jgi:hypothetical protein